jgi:hypothetical protein
LTKTPKLTRAKNIVEWTTYDKQVAEMAKSLLTKDLGARDGTNETVVDESMFVAIDSSSPKEPTNSKEDIKDPVGKDEGSSDGGNRVKDEL